MKQIVHIGVAVSSDGMVPFRSNIINLAAACDNFTFNENVVPLSGAYSEAHTFWQRHPEEFARLKQNPISLGDCMVKFREWLRQFQGTLVACSSAMDHLLLMQAMLTTGKDCPFGDRPIDTNTLAMYLQGKRRPVKSTDRVMPLEVAKARWEMVVNILGVKPQFGVQGGRKPKPKPAPAVPATAPAPTRNWRIIDPQQAQLQAQLRQAAMQPFFAPQVDEVEF